MNLKTLHDGRADNTKRVRMVMAAAINRGLIQIPVKNAASSSIHMNTIQLNLHTRTSLLPFDLASCVTLDLIIYPALQTVP